MRMLLILLGVVGALASACADQTQDVPEPPDMTLLMERYAAPSAPLTAGLAGDLLSQAAQRMGFLDQADYLAPFFSTMEALGEEGETSRAALNASEEPVEMSRFPTELEGTTLEAGAWFRVTRICGGWEGENTPNPDDGYVELLAVADGEGFHPVLWGSLHDCRYEVNGTRLLLNGEVCVYTGTLLTQGLDSPSDVLVDFVGTLSTEGVDTSFAVDFSVSTDGTFSLSLDAVDGNVIFFMRNGLQGFLATNGRWTCDFQQLNCSNESGESLSFSL